MKTHTKIHVLICLALIFTGAFAMEDWETWSKEKLDQEMSPSRWNPTKTADQVINEYVQVSIKDTTTARSSIPNELNITYGNKESQRYDVYGTDLPGDALTFVWLHGGYWQEGSKDISGGLANVLHPQGIRTIAVGYTLAPAGSLQEIEQEMLSALQNIINRYPNSRIVCGGHSAGGQLAAMLLHKKDLPSLVSNKIEGLVLVSGVFDLRPLVPTYVNEPLKLTRESAETSSPLRIREINENFRNKASELKILVTVGEYDPPVFRNQAEEYFSLLKGTFGQTSFWKSPADDHFTLVQNMANSSSSAAKRFMEFMNSCKPKAPTKLIGGSSAGSHYPLASALLNFLIHTVFFLV